MPIQTFLHSFLVVTVTEIGDKTMLATLCFSAQYKRPLTILVLSVFAFAISSIFAALIGIVLTTTLPSNLLTIASGILFLALGFVIFLKNSHKENTANCTPPQTLVSLFTLILSSELGDKSQFAIIALTVNSMFPSFTVLGAILGFLFVNLIGSFVGSKLGEKLSTHLIRYFAATLFIILGNATLFGFLLY